jgi:ribonuclease E
MVKKMLINASDPDELRVAVVEDGRLEGFYVETAAREQTRGNIYKGVVVNVEPSLQAAFVDYGAPRHGFLQVNDLAPEQYAAPWKGKGVPPAEKVLKKGQELLVQVVKEESGSKGASLTTYISLPGQMVVLTVGRESWGVSRQIADEAERARLKKILSEVKPPPGMGLIARTAAEGRSKKDLQAEARMLRRLWEDILRRAKAVRAPALLHKEQELAVRAVRDLFTSDVSEIIVDDPEVYERVERFVALANPRRKQAVKLTRQRRPIFSRYEIEKQLETIYQPQVRLPSGGSIVIQPTEALVAIDVNSGKAVGGKEIEETALNVDLEAAAEIARQLRLRDLGGLIVIDFIDLKERKHQRQVVSRLKAELKKDKAKVSVGSFSRFGLVEMSRQRIRPPVDYGATRTCPHCAGRGVVRTPEAVGRSVLRSLTHKLPGYQPGAAVRLRLAPEVARWLANVKRAELSALELKTGICLEVWPDPELGAEEVRLERLESAWSLPARENHTPETASQTTAANHNGETTPRKRSRRTRRRKSSKAAEGDKS